MGRPVALRAAAIMGYPGEVQPPRFQNQGGAGGSQGPQPKPPTKCEENVRFNRVSPLYPELQTLPR